LVVALGGTLGAGKTRLVRAVARALGIPAEDVTSPTFVLQHVYQGRLPVFHFDAYRLADEDEFLELGPEECFAAPGVTFIEWAERVAQALPEDRLEIMIEVLGDSERRFVFQGQGPAAGAIVAGLEAWAHESRPMGG
jgi:tRNA threonylcarbamoyladenosine biosynthesis protein TsaE